MITKKFFKTKDDCEVTFEFASEEAQQVAVVGEFNNWEPVEMSKAKKEGSPFRTKVRMPKDGEFQFRYLVDGETWVNDSEADAYRPNEYGEENSVVITRD